MNNSFSIKKVDDWIYFCLEEGADELNCVENLYRVNENGTGMIKLIENHSVACIIGEHIYYTVCNLSDDFSNDEDGIYRINQDGSDKLKICNDRAEYANFYSGWIYYCNQTCEDDNSIYKIKYDGSEKTRLNNDRCSDILVCQDWVYFQNASDGYKPYKIRLDGSDRTKLSDTKCHSLYKKFECIYSGVLLESNI